MTTPTTPEQAMALARYLTDPSLDRFTPHPADAMRSLAQQVEELTIECNDSDGTISILAKHLAGVAIALKGPELPLHRHGYQDLAERATIAMLEIELQKVQIAELTAERDAFRVHAELYRHLRDHFAKTATDAKAEFARLEPLTGDAFDAVVRASMDAMREEA